MVSLMLSVMTLAIVGFSEYLLYAHKSKAYNQPLMLLLLCLGLLACGPIVFQLLPDYRFVYIAVLPLVFFALLPSLWIYHLAITSQQPWQWSRAVKKHYRPLIAVMFLSALIVSLPEQEFDQLFFSELKTESLQTVIVSYSFFVALIVWCGMSTLYVFSIVKHSIRYRSELKNVFSDSSGKLLRWIDWLTFLLLFIWLYALLVLVFEDRYQDFMISENGVLLLLLVLVCFLAANGVSQKPGFADVYGAKIENQRNPNPESEENRDVQSKYHRSALDETQAQRIANKLALAIQQQQVHLDPSLTLYKLAKHIGVPNQYLSQTLSQNLQTTFFDYINYARIETAKILLLDSKDSVLSIAMAVGFNARSSFYKAFKQYTGVTPSDFRKQAL